MAKDFFALVKRFQNNGQCLYKWKNMYYTYNMLLMHKYDNYFEKFYENKTITSPLGSSKSKRSVRIPYADVFSCFFIPFWSSAFFILWKSPIAALRYVNFKCWEIFSFRLGEDISCDRPQMPINDAVLRVQLPLFLIAMSYYIIWKNICIV